jgi:hypothetical protein
VLPLKDTSKRYRWCGRPFSHQPQQCRSAGSSRNGPAHGRARGAKAAAAAAAAFPSRGLIRLLPAEHTAQGKPLVERLVAEEYILDTLHFFDGDRVQCARRVALGAAPVSAWRGLRAARAAPRRGQVLVCGVQGGAGVRQSETCMHRTQIRNLICRKDGGVARPWRALVGCAAPPARAGLPLPDKHEALLAEMLFAQMLRLPAPALKPLAYSALMARPGASRASCWGGRACLPMPAWQARLLKVRMLKQ